MLSGNLVPDGATPLAMAYAGHQFGNWVPQLGDGRAILLGELVGKDGIRRDIQLKGAGSHALLPWRRRPRGSGAGLARIYRQRGDGRLGVCRRPARWRLSPPASMYGGRSPEQGAVLTRVARSHVRIGTFEFFANRGDVEGVRALADYVIARHYPEVADTEQPYRALFEAVIGRVAALVAKMAAYRLHPRRDEHRQYVGRG